MTTYLTSVGISGHSHIKDSVHLHIVWVEQVVIRLVLPGGLVGRGDWIVWGLAGTTQEKEVRKIIIR